MRTTEENKQKIKATNLKFYDQLGDELKFKYSKEEQIKSNLGGCLSILGLIFMLIAFWVTANNFVSTESPEVSSYTQFTPNYPKFDLYENSLFMGFILIDINNARVLEAEEIKKYVTIAIKVETVTFMEDSRKLNQKREAVFDYIPCKEITNNKITDPINIDEGTKNLMMHSAVCPNVSEEQKDKFFIQGKPAAPPVTALVIVVDPCSLPDKTQCASKEEIDRTQIMFSETDKSLDMSNMKNPVSSVVKNDRRINLKNKKQYIFQLWYKKNEIWDETQDLKDQEIKFEYVDFDFMEKDSIERNSSGENYCLKNDASQDCNSYIVIEYFVTGKKVIYKRTYNKLLQSLADLGGFKEVVFIFLGLFYWIFSGNRTLKFFKKHLYGIKGKVQEKKIMDMLIKDHRNLSEKDIEKKFEDIIESSLDANFDGVELFAKLNQMMILSEIFFEEHDKKLMPLAVLNATKKIMERKEDSKEAETERVEMSYEEAYRKMVAYQPKNEIKKAIKNFLLENLPFIQNVPMQIFSIDKQTNGKLISLILF